MHKFIFGDEKTVTRFWSKVSVKESGCWEWTACKNENGYGIFNGENIPSRLAHRISYYWTHGEISQILTIDHLCFNRACVNPDHLEECSLIENSMRGSGWGAENKRKTHCPRGHELTEENLIQTQLAWGKRDCKICHYALMKERRDDHDPNWETTAEKTHCVNGHELTEDNLVKSHLKYKERKCKTCHAQRMKGTRQRQKDGTVQKKTNHNSLKTHCKNGHELSGDNLVAAEAKLGGRRCKACSNQKAKESYARAKNGTARTNPDHHSSKKTHCPKGHPLEEGNLVLSRLKMGRRACQICYRESVRESQARLRQRKRAAAARYDPVQDD